MTDLNPNPAKPPRPDLRPDLRPDSMDPDRFDKYGNAKLPVGPPPSAPGAGMAMMGLVLVAAIVGAMIFFFGPNKEYSVKHEDLARSPAATAPAPMTTPSLPPSPSSTEGQGQGQAPVAPLNPPPPQATPSEPQK